VHQTSASSSDLVFDAGLQIRAVPIFTRVASGVVPGERRDPSVVRLADGTWAMYFSAGPADPNQHIGRATSPDGVTWTEDPEPILPGYLPSVIREGGLFRMWYTDFSTGIRLATSEDGVHFTNDWGPVMPPGYGWELGSWGATVVKQGDFYRMWFVGILPSQEATAIGYAVSYDGVGWIRYPRPIIDDATVNTPHVIFDRGEYKMWFTRDRSNVAYATSLDGITWAMAGDTLAPAASPAVLRDGRVLKMWFGDTEGIGYATSP
jgi:predicted GH43/DUF377 family glycosyl hydrolase